MATKSDKTEVASNKPTASAAVSAPTGTHSNAPSKMSREALIAAAAAGKIRFEDTTVGETFGLNYKRLELAPGATSGPLEFVKEDKVPVEKDGQTEMLPMQVLRDAANPESGLISTPIGKVFQKHWNEALVGIGDIVQIHRYADAKMKRGKAAGREIPIYGVKVLFRAVQAPEPVAGNS